MILNKLAPLVAALACAGLASLAHAEGAAGTNEASFGWMHIQPTSSSSDPLVITSEGGQSTNIVQSGTGLKSGSANTLGLSFAHYFTDHISAQLFEGIPPKIDIKGGGSLEPYGKVGELQQWGLVAMGRYHFGEAADKFRPYVGAGVGYEWFRDAKLTNQQFITNSFGPGATTKLSVDSVWAPVVTVGADYAVAKGWTAGLQVLYLPLDLKSKTEAQTVQGPVTVEAPKVTVNPVVTYLNLAYHF